MLYPYILKSHGNILVNTRALHSVILAHMVLVDHRLQYFKALQVIVVVFPLLVAQCHSHGRFSLKPAQIGYQFAMNQIRPITFRSLPFRIYAICVSEHFNGASRHLQPLILRILQFYRLLRVMLHSVNLPQQAKRKCPKLALLLFRRVYFVFL